MNIVKKYELGDVFIDFMPFDITKDTRDEGGIYQDNKKYILIRSVDLPYDPYIRIRIAETGDDFLIHLGSKEVVEAMIKGLKSISPKPWYKKIFKKFKGIGNRR